MRNISIQKDDIKDYLDWFKIQISICSAALGSILFKYGESSAAPLWIKISAALFIFSMLTFLLSYVCLVDYKSSLTPNLNKRTIWYIMISWASFILAFFVGVIQVSF